MTPWAKLVAAINDAGRPLTEAQLRAMVRDAGLQATRRVERKPDARVEQLGLLIAEALAPQRCTRCRRWLLPLHEVYVGDQPYGRVCARKELLPA